MYSKTITNKKTQVMSNMEFITRNQPKNWAPEGYVAKLGNGCDGCAFYYASIRCQQAQDTTPCHKTLHPSGKTVIFVETPEVDDVLPKKSGQEILDKFILHSKD